MPQNVPYNLEAEQAVLGSVIIDNDIITALSDSLTAADFYDRRNQLIYQAMIDLYREDIHIDYTTLISQLNMKNSLENAGGVMYIGTLIDSVYTTANVEDYVTLVIDAASKRNMIAAAESIKNAGGDPNYSSQAYLDYAERVITDIAKRRRTDDLIPMDEVVDSVDKLIQANRNRSLETIGLPTGYKALDNVILGLQKQNLIILAARPSMGKSAFAMNIALNVAASDVNEEGNKPNIAFFSLEMAQEQIAQRMLASLTQIHLGNVQKGNLTQKDMMLMRMKMDELKESNIFFSDLGALTIADIRAKCRKLKNKFGLDLIVIDYLQLINGSARSGANRQEEVSQISRSLKQLARELEVPIIALAQLSRDVEKRDDKRPQMADLRESGSIEQDADIVMFLYREGYYNKNTELPNVAELIIAKNRGGATGNIKFLFKPEYQLFTSYDED